MLLDDTTKKIQLVLTAAATSASMPVCVYYVDSTSTALPVSGSTLTNSNGVTAVDILAAPAASTQRKVNALTVNNSDTAAKTVQIYLDSGGTDYLLCAATLQVGDVLGYTDTRGWYVNDSAGNLKVTPTNAIAASLVTNTPAGNIAAITAQAAINELDTEKMAIATYDADADGIVDQAEAIVLLCRNSTGSTITKMSVVYISGATGQNPSITLAKADAEATSSKTIGVVTADIANNATGYIAMLGEIHDYDTSAFADGNSLWLSATTAGGMTATRPTSPNHAVLIGFVAYAHATNGKIALNVTNGQELNELHNVLIASVADSELLQYDAASATWKNRSVLAGLKLTTSAFGYTTTVTAAGTTTLTASSTYHQDFTGSTTQTVVLPVVSTLTTGHSFYFDNDSTGSLTINSSGGNLVKTIPAGHFGIITCVLTTGTTASSWSSRISQPDTLPTSGNLYSSIYTPTITNGTNVAASTAYSTSMFTRVGSYVFFDITFDADPTAAGTCDLTLSLPIASAFTSDRHLSGAGTITAISAATVVTPLSVYAEVTTDTMIVKWFAVDTGNARARITGKYFIL